MIRVQAPDGTVVEFPDDMPRPAIEYVMRRYAEGKSVSPRQLEAYRRGRDAGPLDAVGRSLAQGLTFGFGDEIAAGARSLFTGTGYRDALEEERAANEGVRAAYPWLSAGAEIAGAMASPVSKLLPALGAASPGAGLAERALRSAVPRGVVSGAVGGAIAGAGEAESMSAVPEEMLRGAAIGGLAGGAISGAISGGGAVAGHIAHGLGLRDPATAAQRQILRALERDGIDERELRTMRFAPDEALVDRAGAALRHLGATVANVPSSAMAAADEFVSLRRYARPDRIAAEVDRVFGGGAGEGMMRRIEALMAQRRARAAPLYARAYEQPVPAELLGQLDPIIRSELGQRALRRGLGILNAEAQAAYQGSVRAGAPDRSLLFDPARYGVRFDGEAKAFVLSGGSKTLALLDAIKRGLDDMVEQMRDPVTMRLNLTDETRAIAALRDEWRQTLREAFPIYGRALDAYAGPTRVMEAMAFGRDALRLDPDKIAQRVQRMSPDERMAAMVGLGRAIADMTADPARAATAARRLVEDRTMQRRLEYLVPDAQKRAQIIDALKREQAMAATERAVNPRAGSQTARLQAGMDDMQIDVPGGAAMALLQGRPGAATGALLGGLWRRFGQGINAATADEVAARLFVADPARNAEIIEELLRRSAADRAAAARLAPVMGGARVGAGAAAAMQSR